MGIRHILLGIAILFYILIVAGLYSQLRAQTICHKFDRFGTMCFPLVVPPDADSTNPPGVVLVHDGYTQWMQPHRPGTSCCNNQDCSRVDARFDEKRKVYQALIDGEWRDIPPHIILDPEKPANHSPDGGYHACWNRATGELLCFREAEPKI